MRVLHIGLSTVMGGIESFALNYFRVLHMQGVVFDFVDIYGAGIAGQDEILELGGQVYAVPNFKRHPLKSILAMQRIMQREKYDSVHVHIASEINFLPLIAAKRAGVKPIAHVHFSAPSSAWRKVLFALVKGQFRKIPSHHFACGTDAGKWFWGSEDFCVISNGVDVEEFALHSETRQTLRQEFDIDDETVALGYVGRFEPVKNPLFTLQVVKNIRERYPDKKVKLLAIGTGSLADEFCRLSKELGVDSCVLYLGYRADISALLSAMDVFLMPSLHEGVSLAAVEAQTSGLHCLFSDSIPKENQVLPRCHFLPLAENLWADAVINIDSSARVDGSAYMESTAYNIRRSAKELAKVYDSISAQLGEIL